MRLFFPPSAILGLGAPPFFKHLRVRKMPATSCRGSSSVFFKTLLDRMTESHRNATTRVIVEMRPTTPTLLGRKAQTGHAGVELCERLAQEIRVILLCTYVSDHHLELWMGYGRQKVSGLVVVKMT